MRSWPVLLTLLFVACTGDPVGDPCSPEHVPQGGFDPAETYVESSSTECMSRVCLVRGLEGDPRPDCTSGCSDEVAIEEHVYCSCRCDDDGSTPGCECPGGYHCEAAGRLGSYCVRD